MIANVRRDLCSPNQQRIKFPFCPSNQSYKYLRLFLRWHFSCSTSLPPLLFKNTPALPPPALGFENSSSRTIRFNNGIHLRDFRGTPNPFTPAFTFNFSSNFLVRISYFHLCPQNLRNNIIILLENQPIMNCLGPMGNPDPTSIINLETSRIPLKSSNMNLYWSQAFRSWPSITPGWRN